MANISALNGIFSCGNDDCDVEQHVDDDWKDLSDDSDGKIRAIGNSVDFDSGLLFKNAPDFMWISNQTLNSWGAVTGVIFETYCLHPLDLTGWHVTAEVG